MQTAYTIYIIIAGFILGGTAFHYGLKAFLNWLFTPAAIQEDSFDLEALPRRPSPIYFSSRHRQRVSIGLYTLFSFTFTALTPSL